MQYSLGLVQASRPVWRIEEWRRGNQGPQAGMIRGQLKAVGPGSEALPQRRHRAVSRRAERNPTGSNDYPLWEIWAKRYQPASDAEAAAHGSIHQEAMAADAERAVVSWNKKRPGV